MEVSADGIAFVRRLLEPPSIETEAEPTGGSVRLPPGVADQLALFADRIADLTQEERQELFDETFGRDPQVAADRRRLAERLAAGPDVERAEIQPLLDRLGRALLRAGNPYHHVIGAARVLFAQR